MRRWVKFCSKSAICIPAEDFFDVVGKDTEADVRDPNAPPFFLTKAMLAREFKHNTFAI